LAQLYPWALDSIFVALYGLLGYDGVILTLLHMGKTELEEIRVTLRLTISQSICLGAEPTLGL
jgi:hypothetical protein